MKDVAFAKFAVLVNGLVPITLLAWAWNHNQLGANPITSALHTTGMVALIFLMLTLSVTPLRKITGWNYLSHFRRMLGLFAFFYASMHLLIYLNFVNLFNFGALWSDLTLRPFILLGMTALAAMVPLAITSTNGMIKRLGAKNWKTLHNLVYVSAIAATIHFWMFPKSDRRIPDIFLAILATLLGYRVLLSVFPNLKKRTTPRPGVVTSA